MGKHQDLRHPQVIFGPTRQRGNFLELLNDVQYSVRIYQQSIQDDGIAKVLTQLCKKGINVEIMMMPFPFGKKEDKNLSNQKILIQSGAKVFLNQKNYIHAKVLIIDHDTSSSIMYIGSCNFYQPLIDTSRELGITTNNRIQIKKIVDIFEEDKKTR